MSRAAIPARQIPSIIRAVLHRGVWRGTCDRGLIDMEIRRVARLHPLEYSVICCMDLRVGAARDVHWAVDEINRIVAAKREAALGRPKMERSKPDGKRQPNARLAAG